LEHEGLFVLEKGLEFAQEHVEIVAIPLPTKLYMMVNEALDCCVLIHGILGSIGRNWTNLVFELRVLGKLHHYLTAIVEAFLQDFFGRLRNPPAIHMYLKKFGLVRQADVTILRLFFGKVDSFKAIVYSISIFLHQEFVNHFLGQEGNILLSKVADVVVVIDNECIVIIRCVIGCILNVIMDIIDGGCRGGLWRWGKRATLHVPALCKSIGTYKQALGTLQGIVDAFACMLVLLNMMFHFECFGTLLTRKWS
jgi:hypothetical protein